MEIGVIKIGFYCNRLSFCHNRLVIDVGFARQSTAAAGDVSVCSSVYRSVILYTIRCAISRVYGLTVVH